MTARMRHGVVDSSTATTVDVSLDGVIVTAFLLDGVVLTAGSVATLIQDGRRLVAVGGIAGLTWTAACWVGASETLTDVTAALVAEEEVTPGVGIGGVFDLQYALMFTVSGIPADHTGYLDVFVRTAESNLQAFAQNAAGDKADGSNWTSVSAASGDGTWEWYSFYVSSGLVYAGVDPPVVGFGCFLSYAVTGAVVSLRAFGDPFPGPP